MKTDEKESASSKLQLFDMDQSTSPPLYSVMQQNIPVYPILQ